MQTQSSDRNNPTSSTPAISKRSSHEPIIPEFELAIQKNGHCDVVEILRQAANQSGFNYLFEIPSVLLGAPEKRAAAICPGAEGGNTQFLFILCDAEEGIISVLDLDEIPEAARRFFLSYASVLANLGKISAVKNLH